MHRGVRPQPRELPDYVVPLGRTLGLPANGAVSNLVGRPGRGAGRCAASLRTGGYDVVHVHEPIAPMVSWVAASRAVADAARRHLPLLTPRP